MSGQIRLQSAQYVGIINGIVYRIDTNLSRCGERVALVPLDVDTTALDRRLAPSESKRRQPNTTDARPAATDDSDETKVERGPPATEAPDLGTARDLGLFTREGPEPLRAGHPDLWRLLVAGTCLEGSAFRSN